MCATASDLADDRRTLEGLKAVAELLSAGKGPRGGEHIHRNCGETLAWDLRKRPRLARAVARAVEDIVEVRRPAEQVAAKESDHPGIAPAVVAQIENQRVGVGQEAHRGHRRGSALLDSLERIELHVADTVRQHLHPVEPAIAVSLHELPLRISRHQVIRKARGREVHSQMPVTAELTHLLGQRERQHVSLGHQVVVVMLQMQPQEIAQPFRRIGEDVHSLELRDRLLDDVVPRLRIDREADDCSIPRGQDREIHGCDGWGDGSVDAQPGKQTLTVGAPLQKEFDALWLTLADTGQLVPA